MSGRPQRERELLDIQERLERELAAALKLCVINATQRDEALADAQEQARLNGMGSEREARLIAQRDEARAALREAIEALEDPAMERYLNDGEIERWRKAAGLDET